MSGPDLEDRLDHLLRSVAAGVALVMWRRSLAEGAVDAWLAGQRVVGSSQSCLPAWCSPGSSCPTRPHPGCRAGGDRTGRGRDPRQGRALVWRPRRRRTTGAQRHSPGRGRGGRPTLRPLLGGVSVRSPLRARPGGGTVHRFRSKVPLAKDHAGARIGRTWNVVVPLPDELRGRPVVDGATGQPKPVAEGPLISDWLPFGWVQQTEPGSGGALWQREYEPVPVGRPSPSDARVPRIAKDGPLLLGPANHVTVAAVPPALLETWDRRPGTRAVASVLVRGVRAAVDWSEADRLVTLRWREGDRAYVVVGHGSDGADLRDVQALVVSLARSLRRPCEPPPPIETWAPHDPSGTARPDQSRCR
jgi:hypothetical protein